ncbi:16S rRNA (guanine(966)-N(2))-methyltransferase RsmD [Kangiella koreensis]|uniref:Ribosomal RNA small subunit methyltransferase D n=1 Tax=Kangiella koreensis (strain DSM 16069 / JCM 12317 / KCTC 12182 / SW-125) TaxID=523791 RepID=C7R9V4_KANKD|nr:16S rRNA (guanine(966)-N(2))-methyltransferase RsmD [Kangiella koreensis]ACV27973.1 methyltransferase [Kangiella koreensis DSM 16069]
MANRNKIVQDSKKKSTSPHAKKVGQFRVIGGRWKGRKLRFIEVEGLRPSLDRIRETLFNWLQNEIHGANCLDLFAGSGAIGIEALSRGASEASFVELNRKAFHQLEENLGLVNADNAYVMHGDAFDFIQSNQKSFDIIFLDPPFHKGIAQKVIEQLDAAEWLKPETLIYIEVEQGLELNVPENWTELKDKKAGQLQYKLFAVT